LISDRENDLRRGQREFTEFGLCCSCNNLAANITDYGSKFAKCSETNRRLSSTDPVKHCTMYYRYGLLDLKEMKEMAILIDAKGSRKIGFLYDEDEPIELGELYADKD